MNGQRGLVLRFQELCPRIDFTLALQGRGQNGWPDFRDNVLGDSASRDKHQEGIR